MKIGFIGSGNIGTALAKIWLDANILASDSRDFNGETPVMFYCGDDTDAKEKVAPLIEDAGFE